MVNVFVARIKENIHDTVATLLQETGLLKRVKGASILIKPNLFEPIPYTTGQTTNPHLIEAVVKWCTREGAKQVIVGEGPSYFLTAQALKDCFTKTGVAEAVERQGAQWLLFDDHRFRTFSNSSPYLPEEFRISEHAFAHDILINLPVPKTHYLTKVSIAMKNLKGFLKREDKPLFHRVGIGKALVELNKIITPTINLVDFTVTSHNPPGFVLAGKDIVSVDSVASSLIGLDPYEIDTIRLGAQAGLGEMELPKINILGEDIKDLKMKYELPAEWLQTNFPLIKIVGSDEACSGCLIPLFNSLSQLAAEGRSFIKPLTLILGRTGKHPVFSSDFLIIGECSSSEKVGLNQVRGCPPQKEDIFKTLYEYTKIK